MLLALPLFPCAECPPCASNALLASQDCCPAFGEQKSAGR